MLLDVPKAPKIVVLIVIAKSHTKFWASLRAIAGCRIVVLLKKWMEWMRWEEFTAAQVEIRRASS